MTTIDHCTSIYIFFFDVIDFWWSYITIFLCYRYIIYQLQLQFFTPYHSFNRRSPFNRLWNEPKAFLVAIPDSIAFVIVHPSNFSFYTLDFPLLDLHVQSSSSNDTFFASSLDTIHSSFKRNNVGEGIWTLDPWHRMNLLTNKPTRPRCPTKRNLLKFGVSQNANSYLSLINKIVQ